MDVFVKRMITEYKHHSMSLFHISQKLEMDVLLVSNEVNRIADKEDTM